MPVNANAFQQRLLATAMLSASALLLEIVLTRLFSLLYFPPYVFFIISIAILGIGLGAAVAAFRPELTQENRLALYSVGAAISTVALIIFAVFGASLNLQILLFALAALLYFFIGLAISSLFSQRAESSRMLYMSDLVGAGIGAIVAVPLLNTFGAVNAAIVAALGFAVAGIYLSVGAHRLWVVLSIALSAGLLGVNALTDVLEVDLSSVTPDKPIVASLSSGGKILDTRWDAFARTDLVDPGDDKPLRIFVDGGAASIIPSESARGDLIRDIGFFPFATMQPEKVFIIGPGGGLDVYFALQGNAQEITAVEVNPASVALVEDWRAYTGSLFDRPEVELLIGDGRSELRRSSDKYDLIYLSQVVTLAAERGGYALSENTVYTVDSFSEYLDHLDDDGQIALKMYDEITLSRAVSTALAALRHRGLSDQQAIKHLMAFLDKDTPLLLISNKPFSEDDSLVLGAIAREVGFTPLLLPHVWIRPPLDAVDRGETTFEAVVAASQEDISPPTEDRPYFFQFEKGIPQNLVPLTLIAALVTLVILGFIGLQRRKASDIATRCFPAYFALLGAGFIAIEIYAIQQTRLFLGHPTFAVTLVLATFLLGGGLGSGLSQRYMRSILGRYPQLAAAAVVALLSLWSLLWSLFSRELLGAEITMRAVVVVATLLPLAFCMGIPFPQALEAVGRIDRRQVAMAWSVNGLTTVVGTVAAVVLSITVGFKAVLVLGGAAYLLAALIMAAMRAKGDVWR